MEKGLGASPPDPNPILEELLVAHANEDDWTSYLAVARRLLERLPEKAESRYNMGLGYFGLKNWDASVIELEAAKARNMEDNQLKLNQHLGYAYLILKKFEEAAAAYQLAANLDPQNPDVTYNLGLAYCALKDKPNAKRQAGF